MPEDLNKSPQGNEGGEARGNGQENNKAQGNEPKNVSYEEFKKVIAERKKWKEKARKLEQEIEAIKSRIPDEEEYKEYIEWRKKRAEEEEERKRKEGEFEKWRKEIVEKHNQEISKFQEEIAKRERFIEQLMIEQEIIKAASKYNAYNPQQVVKLVRDNIRLINQDGKFKVIVVDEEGQPRYDEKGDEMSVEVYVKEYLEENPNLVKANVRSGSGTTLTGGGSEVDIERLKAEALQKGDYRTYIRLERQKLKQK